MSREQTARDQAQRRMLVALADSAPMARRRPRALVALAVFALAGALTGAAVSATAAVLTAGRGSISQQEPTIGMLAALVPGDTRLLGEPFTVEEGDGPTTIDVGQAPDGATELFVSFGCLGGGVHATSIDGAVTSTYLCTEPGIGSGSGGGHPVSGSGPHAIEVTGEGRYLLWASWSAPPAPVEASAEQSAALADGVVTEAEYREGFARYQRCMTEAGYLVSVSDAPGPLISYTSSDAAVDSGVEGACYAAEFDSVDLAWQSSNR
jgi:hypothetical protein